MLLLPLAASLTLLMACQAEPQQAPDGSPAAHSSQTSASPPRDVILLTIDTLRYDHVSSQDSASPSKTPHIDALAKQGVSYTQTYAPVSVTGPSFITLFTGLFPRRHGAVMNGFRGGNALDEAHETLTEQLKGAGFQTAAFVSGFTLRPALGLDQGFDIYSDSSPKLRRSGTETAKAAIDWLTSLKTEDRAFLWFHTFDAHGPWTEVDEPAATQVWTRHDHSTTDRMPYHQVIDDISDPEFYKARYARSVEHTDAQIGEIITALKNAKRYEEALIILTADHGESFTERELWFGHGTSALEEQLHVPLIVKRPGAVRAGQRSTRLTSLADIMPSVQEWLDMTQRIDLDGLSFAEAKGPGHSKLLGESSHCKDHIALTCAPLGSSGKEFAMRTNRDTILRQQRENVSVWTRYDRSQDKHELHPKSVPETAPGKTALKAEVAWRKQHPFQGLVELQSPQNSRLEATSQTPAEEASNPDWETESLKKLGYLD